MTVQTELLFLFIIKSYQINQKLFNNNALEHFTSHVLAKGNKLIISWSEH